MRALPVLLVVAAITSAQAEPLLPRIELFPSMASIQLDEEEEKYTETSFRRAEIVFLLALPFVVISHVAIVGGLNFAASDNNSFDIPNEAAGFIGVSSLFVSGAITYWDYQATSKSSSTAEGGDKKKQYWFGTGIRF